LKKDLSIYLDSASTTKVDARVLEVMIPYFSEYFGNASSNHQFGKTAKKAIEIARKQVADIINCDYKEIIFTSGATESINLAIKGFTEFNIDKGNHIITVKTEHKAVLSTCEYLETKGFEVTYLDVDKNGLILFDQLRDSVKENTSLIVIMHVNNETGVVQPIKEIGEFAKDNNIAFFCDATQAVGKLQINVEEDLVDMLCFSAHKLNGPKGIGVLYKRKGLEITPLFHGGGQENGLRAGTYNTPLIVGLGKACELAFNELETNNIAMLEKQTALEKYYEDNNIGVINFKNAPRAPHIISITLNNFEGEEYLILKAKEFAASTGSACNAEIIEVSHVLKALKKENNKNIIRLSI
jgi:cysteine desulfurase